MSNKNAPIAAPSSALENLNADPASPFSTTTDPDGLVVAEDLIAPGERKEWERSRLCAEVGELFTKELILIGDGSLHAKSRRLLTTFAHQALVESRVDPILLGWVAGSIASFLSGKDSSLDAAFRVRPSKGRPLKLTPNRRREIVEKYFETLRQGGGDARTDQDIRRAQDHAFDQAFKVHFGASPGELRESGEDAGSVSDKRTQISKVLAKFIAPIKRPK